MTHVSVLHNVNFRLASLGLNVRLEPDDTECGYVKVEQPRSHRLVRVFEYDTDETVHHDVLAAAFETFNVGEDELAQRYRARKLRSLSVGDVVQVAGTFYSCDPVGWTPRLAEELLIVDEFDPVAEYGELAVTVPLDVPRQVIIRTATEHDWKVRTGGGESADRPPWVQCSRERKRIISEFVPDGMVTYAGHRTRELTGDDLLSQVLTYLREGGRHKLTDAQVAELRREYDSKIMSATALAAKHGISRATLYRLLRDGGT